MGMHEIEDAVEHSIALLSKTERLDKKDLIHTLYQYQCNYDTGYTHFRIIEILLRERFVYQLPLHEHPDYVSLKEDLDKFNSQKSGWIYLHPQQKVSAKNPSVAYWNSPFMYVDAGSILWEKLVSTGKLTGLDSIKPKDLGLLYTANEIIKQALKSEVSSLPLIAWWYALVPMDFAMGTLYGTNPAGNPLLNEIHQLCVQSGAHKVQTDYGLLKFPSLDDLKEFESENELHSFLMNWFAPSWR